MSKYVKRSSSKKFMGAIWSKNPRKAERTIKKLSPAKKRALFR